MEHLLEPALIEQIDDQLQFVEAFEIGDLGLVTGLDQRLEAGVDQFRRAAAQHGLLAEQVGFGFLGKGGLDRAGAGAADALRIGQRLGAGGAGRVLLHREQARHAAADLIFAADQVARPLGRDQDHVGVRGRIDLAILHREAVRDEQRRAVVEVRRDRVREHRPVAHVGGEQARPAPNPWWPPPPTWS